MVRRGCFHPPRSQGVRFSPLLSSYIYSLARGGLDMAFWNKSKPENKPALHTNAPRHWPAMDSPLLSGPAGLIMIGAQLATALHKPPQASVAFMRDFLYDDGILRVPIVIEEGGQKTCVFVYTADDENAAAHYSGVRSLLRT